MVRGVRQGEIPQVVSFLNLQREGDGSQTLSQASSSQPNFDRKDMHRLVRPEKGVERPGAQPDGQMFIPFLPGKAAGGNPSFREAPPESREHELQLDEAVLASAHAALTREVRNGNDFRVQEILQVTPGIRKDLLQRRNSDGNTVLHLAASVSCEQGATVLSYLQYCSADLEAKNMLGETALFLAVRQALDQPGQDALELVSCLLKGRADPNTSDLLNKETPLMEAACYGNKAVAQLLLDFQADVAQATDSGSTALDFASSEGHEGVAKILAAVARARSKPLWEAPFATTMGFATWSAGTARPPETPKAEAAVDPPKAEGRRAAPKPGLSEQMPNFVPTMFDFGPQIRSRIFVTSSEFQEFADSYRPPQTPPSRPAPPSAKAPPRREQRISKDISSEYFATLGLQSGATVEDVRAAYRKLALQYHPATKQHVGKASCHLCLGSALSPSQFFVHFCFDIP